MDPRTGQETWRLGPTRAPFGRRSASTPCQGEWRRSAIQSLQIGGGTGLLGGDIEDAAIGRYAMGRTPKDPNSSDERDLGNALGMQNFTDFGG